MDLTFMAPRQVHVVMRSLASAYQRFMAKRDLYKNLDWHLESSGALALWIFPHNPRYCANAPGYCFACCESEAEDRFGVARPGLLCLESTVLASLPDVDVFSYLKKSMWWIITFLVFTCR